MNENDSDRKIENGIQPLDRLLVELGLQNKDLVEKSTEQLSYKVIAKARKGRRLTINAKHKILNAVNSLRPAATKTYKLQDLFNY